MWRYGPRGSRGTGRSPRLRLDVFRFLRDLVSLGGGFQEAITRRGGVSAIRCLAARLHSDVEIHVDIRPDNGPIRWQYELALNQDTQRKALVRKERVLRNGDEILPRPTADDKADPARLTQANLEQVNVNREFRDLATFFADIR